MRRRFFCLQVMLLAKSNIREREREREIQIEKEREKERVLYLISCRGLRREGFFRQSLTALSRRTTKSASPSMLDKFFCAI